MDAERFRDLSARERALTSLAVLLDGREAAAFLEIVSKNGQALRDAALELGELEPELRMPYVGTALRTALAELRER
jgi:hypothetical protein